jgi:hypothetical protein
MSCFSLLRLFLKDFIFQLVTVTITNYIMNTSQ